MNSTEKLDRRLADIQLDVSNIVELVTTDDAGSRQRAMIAKSHLAISLSQIARMVTDYSPEGG